MDYSVYGPLLVIVVLVGVLIAAVLVSARASSAPGTDLHLAEATMRDDLIARANSLQDQVDALRQRMSGYEDRDLFWRSREVDWRRFENTIRAQYNTLLAAYTIALVKAGDVVPAPLQPPDAPGPVTDVLAENPRYNPPGPRAMLGWQTAALLAILLPTQLGSDKEARDGLLNADLPQGYLDNLHRAGSANVDLRNMIEAAVRYGPPTVAVLLDHMEEALGKGSQGWAALKAWRGENYW